jgi:hypothetical protein
MPSITARGAGLDISDMMRSVPSRLAWPSANADVVATPKASDATVAFIMECMVSSLSFHLNQFHYVKLGFEY